MIDSHCHLDHEPLLSDLSNVIKRSKDVGIKKLLTISTSFESFDRIKKIIQKDEMIYGTIGIHPHETTENKITSDIIIKNIKSNPKIIGIGETGLDFYYNNSDKNDQIVSFKEHIEASIKTNTPLIENALQKSELGINPQIDGQIIRLRIPDLTEERRKDLIKVLKNMGEKYKVAIRNIRREANEDLKKKLKEKIISEDDNKNFEKNIQKLTDSNIENIEKILTEKEKEIIQI